MSVVNVSIPTVGIVTNGVEEIFSMGRKPDYESKLVLAGKQEILNNLSIKTVIHNIDLSADLMYVAYCALAGTQLQSKMSGLQKELMEACSESYLAAGIFEDEAKAISHLLEYTFKYLLRGKEKIALAFLQRCAKSASHMADTSKKVAKEFQDLVDSATDILMSSQDLESIEFKREEKFDEARRALETLREKQKKNQKAYAESVNSLEKKFQEAKKKEYEEYEKGLVLGFMGVIVGAIGAGVGGGLSAAANPSAGALAATSSLTSIGENTSAISTVSTEMAQSLREEKIAYLNQRFKMEEKNIEALGELAKIAAQLKNTAIEKNMATAAKETLHLAVEALSAIVVAMNYAHMFWRSMETHCKGLAENSISEIIVDLKDEPLEDKLELYTDPFFMGDCVAYMAKWVALEEVCKDYVDSAMTARNKVANNILKSPTIEEAIASAPKLAQEFLTQVNLDIKVGNKKLDQINIDRKNI